MDSEGALRVREICFGGGCERGWGSLEWGSRRANERGWKEALGTGLRARLRRRVGGEKEARTPLDFAFLQR